jgi:hypothetical protein
MSIEKRKKFNLLSLIALLWGLSSPVCLGMAVFFVAFYDSPANPEAGLGLTDTLLIGTVFAFPILAFLSSLGIWIFNHRSRVAAIFIAVLPLIPLIPLLIIFTRPSSNLMKDLQNADTASECVPPVLDIGDGLTTTRCGSVEYGKSVTSTFHSISEAHHWQVEVQGPISIMIENDGVSCPHLMVLDQDHRIVERFEERNELVLCVDDMTTTSHFQFSPLVPGTYILRVFSPEASGQYWLQIKQGP